MKKTIVDLKDCLYQLDLSNQIRIKAKHSFPPLTDLDQYEKLTSMVDEDISSLINNMKNIVNEMAKEGWELVQQQVYDEWHILMTFKRTSK